MGANLTGSIYTTSEEVEKVHSLALSRFGKSNLLHADIFTSTRQMEAEVIRMTLNLYHGDSNSCGSVTMGGTESILLAVKAYRDRTGFEKPNIVIPSTAHAAFIKACDYFKIEARKAKCDADRNYEVNMNHMSSLIDGNTIMLVGSAPNYPHGTIDPIPAIAKLAASRNIGCHVDACLGSLLLPFLNHLPYSVDFSVTGVTSISCDTHKYGYAPKGSSVLMYRSTELRKH
jgi:sphinganine-1-phosphate aldolase